MGSLKVDFVQFSSAIAKFLFLEKSWVLAMSALNFVIFQTLPHFLMSQVLSQFANYERTITYDL